MNILGEGFPKEIIDQVDVRQKVYGSGFANGVTRTPEEILYLNSNTAWCKLISSVNIVNSNLLDNEIIKNLSLQYKGDQLARDFILFNGTTALGKSQKSGFGFDQTDRTSKAYNSWKIFDSNKADFGFRPMAGIQSVTVKHKNRGSIRAATVNIKAWDKVSFEIVDILYLRLGFTVLLEWGNTLYFNNSNQLQTNIDNSLAEEFLNLETKSQNPETKEITTEKATYYTFLGRINQQRKLSLGNYDAMLGRVSNIHWSFQPDGSYDIVLDIISVGDVVDSFKMTGNALSLGNTSDSKDNGGEENSKDPFTILKKYAPTNDLLNYLYSMAYLLYSPKASKNFLYNINKNTSFRRSNYFGTGGEFEKATENSTSKQYPNGNPTKDACIVKPPPAAAGNYYSFFMYIRLGNLLKFLEEAIMYEISDNDSGNNKNSLPMLNFDYSVDDNLMHAPPQLMSYDPSVCMVRRFVEFPSPSSEKPPIIENREYFNQSRKWASPSDTTMTNDFADSFMVDGLSETGKIMNIYVNAIYILNKINELTNQDTSQLSLIDFLKGILTGINGALAGYSNLDLFLDETTNTVKIIDQNPLPSTEETINYLNGLKYIGNNPINIPIDTAKFELYGYAPPPLEGEVKYAKASFIKEFNFTTEIPPEFSTMINVSATSQGNVIGENNTALSRLNKGLEDKYKKAIFGGGDKLLSQAKDKKEKLKDIYKSAANEFITTTENFKKYINNLYEGKWYENEFPDYKNSAVIYFRLYKKFQKAMLDYWNYDPNKPSLEKEVTKFQPGTGFIPFNLSLKMDGLSGMKIGSKLNVDTSYLPSNYPSTLEFLIKNVMHEIKDNRWTTSLESFTIAKSPKTYKNPDPSSTPAAASTEEAPPPQSTETTTEQSKTEEPTKGPQIDSKVDEDFWTLLVVCSFEDRDAQGRADVAQSIYNRVASKAYQSTIAKVIKQNSQYEPAFGRSNGEPNLGMKTSTTWKNIKDRDTAIAAIESHGNYKNSPLAWLKETYEALRNSSLQQNSKNLIQGRTDFLSITQGTVNQRNIKRKAGPYDPSKKRGTFVMRENGRPNNVFGWAYNYTSNIVADPPSQDWWNSFSGEFKTGS